MEVLEAKMKPIVLRGALRIFLFWAIPTMMERRIIFRKKAWQVNWWVSKNFAIFNRSIEAARRKRDLKAKHDDPLDVSYWLKKED